MLQRGGRGGGQAYSPNSLPCNDTTKKYENIKPMGDLNRPQCTHTSRIVVECNLCVLLSAPQEPENKTFCVDKIH